MLVIVLCCSRHAADRPRVSRSHAACRYVKLLFSGAMSAVVSRTCVAPLERVKMDLLLKNGTGDAFTTAAQVRQPSIICSLCSSRTAPRRRCGARGCW